MPPRPPFPSAVNPSTPCPRRQGARRFRQAAAQRPAAFPVGSARREPLLHSVAWTELVANPARPVPPSSLVGSASDLLRLRQRVDCLLRRLQVDPASNQKSSTQENQHASAATGTLECRTSSDSTGLSTAHAGTTQSTDPSLGPTHLEVGASGSAPSFTCNRKPPL